MDADPINNFQLVQLADVKRFAAVVKSKAKPGKFDIVTEKGIFDWFSNPILIGFTGDDTLLYRALTPTKDTAGNSICTGALYLEKEKVTVITVPLFIPSPNLKDGLPSVFLAPDGSTWGYAEGKVIDASGEILTATSGFGGQCAPSSFVAITKVGKKTIAYDGKTQIVHVTPDGQVVADDLNIRYSSGKLFIDGVDSGFKGSVLRDRPSANAKPVISPDGTRIDLRKGEDNIGSPIIVCFFTTDSKHFVATTDMQRTIDGKKIAIKLDPPVMKTFSEKNYRDDTILNVGSINRLTEHFVIWNKAQYYIPGADAPVKADILSSFSPVLSDDDKTVLTLDRNGAICIDGQATKLFGTVRFSGDKIVLKEWN
jgi:hypothetical protein